MRIISQNIFERDGKIVVDVQGIGISGEKEFATRVEAVTWVNQLIALVNLKNAETKSESVDLPSWKAL